MELDPDSIRNLCKRLALLEDNERTKLEVKQKWYDLSGAKKRDIEEFCKDLTAMANAPGPEGYIIIGIDEKNGKFSDAPFRNSNLKDLSELQNLVVSRIRNPLQFDLEQVNLDKEKVTISIIKVPRSISKPHMMKIYRKYNAANDELEKEIEEYTPIRHGARIFTANHFDFELMFLDRQNIIPDYNLSFIPIHEKFAYNLKTEKGDIYLTLTIRFLIQNTGRNPIAITSARLILDSISPNLSHTKNSFEWFGKVWVLMQPNVTQQFNYILPFHPIIIPYNDILQLRIEFWSKDLHSPNSSDPRLTTWRNELDNMNKFNYTISIGTSNNKTFTSDTWEFEF
jgi:hypothetical protein